MKVFCKSVTVLSVFDVTTMSSEVLSKLLSRMSNIETFFASNITLNKIASLSPLEFPLCFTIFIWWQSLDFLQGVHGNEVVDFL